MYTLTPTIGTTALRRVGVALALPISVPAESSAADPAPTTGEDLPLPAVFIQPNRADAYLETATSRS
jgi:hypothetical protein